MIQLPADSEAPPTAAEQPEAWALLQIYSDIPADEVEDHLKAIRERAWSVVPYGCIGRWRFLDLYLPETLEYPLILQRVQAGETFLDCGCCFGQVLRQLAFDGAPSKNLYGCDLRQEFLDLGYDLFKDQDTFQGSFVAGDLLDPDNTSLEVLDGKMDMVHAASLFHLFEWQDQVDIGVRMVRFFKAGARQPTVIGRQLGSREPMDPEKHMQQGRGRYHHNAKTLQQLWDEIGLATGTTWTVDMASLEEAPVPSGETTETPLVLRYVVVQTPQTFLGRMMARWY